MRVATLSMSLVAVLLATGCGGGERSAAHDIAQAELPPVEEVLCSQWVIDRQLGINDPRTDVYALPHLLGGSLDNLSQTEGFRRIARVRLRKANCSARPLGRLAKTVTKDAAFWWVLVEAAGRQRGWIALINPTKNLPFHIKGRGTRSAFRRALVRDLSRLPVVTPAPLAKSGRPDLAFGREAGKPAKPGDPCVVPGVPVYDTHNVRIVNRGRGATPAAFTVLERGADYEYTERWSFVRGLEPGESYEFEKDGPARLELDPKNEIVETDEGNNEIGLGETFGNLVCEEE